MGRSKMIAFVLALVAMPAMAIDVPDYGFEWATITDPGNPPFEGPDYWDSRGELGFGRCDHIYRIAVTKITSGEWLEFVEAYAPHYNGAVNNVDFLGWDIRFAGADQHGVPQFYLISGRERYPVDVSWFYAARYCNWLHNGKSGEVWAFENGAYDTTHADAYEQGERTEPYGRNEGALFWIPSEDEWVKAMYWDPDRHGPGEGGYWRYPHGKDVPPVSGLPGLGGETSSGDYITNNLPFDEWFDYYDVGLYTDTRSPWGLLDGSGCRWEWCEFDNRHGRQHAVLRGSTAFAPAHEFVDSIDSQFSSRVVFTNAIRIASVADCFVDDAPPFGLFDLRDITAFVEAYLTGDPFADLDEPFGVFSSSDVARFVLLFQSRSCGE